MDQEQADALHEALIARYSDPAERLERIAWETYLVSHETKEALQQIAKITEMVERVGLPGVLKMMVTGGPKESRRERKAREAAERGEMQPSDGTTEEISEPPEPNQDGDPSQAGGSELHVTLPGEDGVYRCTVEGCDFARDGSGWADAHEATGSTDFDTLADWIAANPEVPSDAD